MNGQKRHLTIASIAIALAMLFYGGLTWGVNVAMDDSHHTIFVCSSHHTKSDAGPSRGAHTQVAAKGNIAVPPQGVFGGQIG